MEYYLMNKDTKLMKFSIDGEGVMEQCSVIEQYTNLPIWFPDIDTWISKRSAAKYRKHVQSILDMMGGRTLSGFVGLTHCLSLNDTLWIKSALENINWDNVSLYSNDFDEVVSKLSFDGNGLCGMKFSTTSPELTTDGAFDKCWVKEDDIYLIKAGSTGASNAGREPYSEVLASQVYTCLCENSVQYKLTHYDGRVVSKCKLFTAEEYGYKAAAIFNLVTPNISKLLNEFSKFGGENNFRRMIVADAVCINQDRHFGNFGFLVNNETFERVAMAPVFDYNLAMFPYADWYEGFPDMDKWIRERGPQIGIDYYETAKALMTTSIRSDLINLKDLVFEVNTDDKFDKNRLAIVNEFKNIQIDRLLGNHRQFDFTAYGTKVNPLLRAANKGRG